MRQSTRCCTATTEPLSGIKTSLEVCWRWRAERAPLTQFVPYITSLYLADHCWDTQRRLASLGDKLVVQQVPFALSDLHGGR